MKKYIVTLDSKNPGMDVNTMDSVHIAASDYKAAVKAARRYARHEKMVVVSVRVIR